MSFGDAGLAHELPKAEVGRDPRPFAGEIAAGFAPGAGLADAAGKFPSFTNEEQQYYDGLITNVQNGQYGIAAMQGLAMLGDAMWAGGPLAGAVGTVGKVPLALSRAIARTNKNFQHWQSHGVLSRVDSNPTTTPYFVDAEGHPMVLVHGTDSMTDFDVPATRRTEMGWHLDVESQQFGDQALDFISPSRGSESRRLEEIDNFYDHGRLIPVFTNVSNPIRLPDLGGWAADNRHIYRALSDYDIDRYSALNIINRIKQTPDEINSNGDLIYNIKKDAIDRMKRELRQFYGHSDDAVFARTIPWWEKGNSTVSADQDEFIRGFIQRTGQDEADDYLVQGILTHSTGSRKETLTKSIHSMLEQDGYDGIVYYNRAEGLPDNARSRIEQEYGSANWRDMDDNMWQEAVYEVLGLENAPEALIVFHPTQVKSAVGNTGEYSRFTASITDSTGDRFGGYQHMRDVPETPHQLTEVLDEQRILASGATKGVTHDYIPAPMPQQLGISKTKAIKKQSVVDYIEKGGKNITGNILYMQASPAASPGMKEYFPEGTYQIMKNITSPNDGLTIMRVKNLQTGELSHVPATLLLEADTLDVFAVYPKSNHIMHPKLLGSN